MKKETTSIDDLMQALALFDELRIAYWLDGGWGVDALVGRQTREHRDIDIDFDSRYLDEVLSRLQAAGYVIDTDWRPVRIELYHEDLGYLDVHPFELNQDGTARQADLAGGWYEFEADYFGRAVFAGRDIPCISPKGQQIFHSGYELREVDKEDLRKIAALLRE